MREWSVYIVKCSDGSLYCGITKDIEARLKKHNAGTASIYTRSRLPVVLVAIESGFTISEALKLERKIKDLPRSKKLDWVALHKI